MNNRNVDYNIAIDVHEYYNKVWNSILEDGFSSYPLKLWNYEEYTVGLGLGSDRKARARPFYVIKDYINTKPECYAAIGGHRYLMLKKLDSEHNIHEVETFIKDHNPNIASKEEFEKFIKDLDTIGATNQAIRLPYGLSLDGRDNVVDLFKQMLLPHFFWYDKTILDVACSAGMWGIECLLNAAKFISGFVKCNVAIKKANKLRSLFKYEDRCKFFCSLFSDVNWNNIDKHDIVFLNQCIYNIPEGEKVLDIINDKCNNFLIMYTWTIEKHPFKSEGGFNPSWTPTVLEVRDKMVSLGFKYVYTIIKSNKAKDFIKNPVKTEHKQFFIGAREKDIDSQFYFLPNNEYDAIELAPGIKPVELRLNPENF